MDLSQFSLFVSLDPKNPVPVTRFGPGTLIAADRDGRDIRYRTDEVVAITARELAQYGREYGRALRDGSLLSRTEKDYEAFLAKQKRAERERGEAVKRRKAVTPQQGEAPAGGMLPPIGDEDPVTEEREAEAVTEELTGGS